MEHAVILIVEDNDRLRSFMSSSLKKEDFTILEAPDGKAARDILRKEFIDLVLLDLNLGDSNGIDILRTIRRQDEELPVIIISSDQSHNSKVDGFDVGCDDYITKPFYVDELLGRVRRILKRARPRTNAMRIHDGVLCAGPFTINLSDLSVVKDGKTLDMRKKLFDLFLFFVRHPGMVLTNEAFFDRAWDIREGVNTPGVFHPGPFKSLVESLLASLMFPCERPDMSQGKKEEARSKAKELLTAMKNVVLGYFVDILIDLQPKRAPRAT